MIRTTGQNYIGLGTPIRLQIFHRTTEIIKKSKHTYQFTAPHTLRIG